MHRIVAVLLVSALLPASVCFAQVRRPDDRQPAREPAARAAAPPSDQQLAACLHGMCRNHIELARFAQSRLQNEDAKEFAAQMVKDHEPGCKKLAQLAGPLAASAPTTPPRAETRPADAPRTTPREGDVRVGGAGGALDWVKIHRELADQCLATSKREFESKKSGGEFDKCYMTHEVVTHLEAIDKMKVLRNHASAELKKDLDESIEMAMNHLKKAKSILETMKDDGVPRTSRKPE
jgi:predicted outer membrane protein